MTQGARIIDGRALAARTRVRLAEEISRRGREVTLAVLLVGDDPASAIYVRGKERAASEVGIRSLVRREPNSLSQEGAERIVEEWANDSTIHAILVQLPLPPGLNTQRVIRLIPPEKDVDGLTPASLGLLVRNEQSVSACTPTGCMELLREAGCTVSGKSALVVGRSVLVGLPIALLLTHADATVSVAHSRTRDLEKRVGEAEILIAATGVPGLIPGHWVKRGAFVLDVGITRTPEGLRGDVCFEQARGRAAAITPVPGGVGPMTIASLMANTLRLAEKQEG